MSSATINPADSSGQIRSRETVTAVVRPVVHPVSLRRSVVSEWIKLRSLRSTVIVMAVSFVAMAGIGILIATSIAHQWPTMPAAQRQGFDPVGTALSGYNIAQLAAGVLGVLVVTGEYATGMIRSTLASVPRRLPMLWAKSLVFGAVTLAMTTAAAFIAFFGSQEVLSAQHIQTTITAPGVFRAVVGAALYLTLVGLTGVALGALIRNTAGAISTLFAIILLLPQVVGVLPQSIANDILPFLPSNTGDALMSVHRLDHMLSPWTGFAVLCGYVVVGLAGAAYLLKRRDA
ncbi:MAG TPA: ABC transporter permease [Actinocrinis sp.]|jgi:hypothetical protein